MSRQGNGSGPPAEHRYEEFPSLPSFARQRGDRISAQVLAGSGIAGFLASCWLANRFELSSEAGIVALCLAGTAFPLVVLSVFVLKVYRRPSTGICEETLRSLDWLRVGTKLLGLVAVLIPFGVVYWLIPEYSRPFYAPVWEIATWVACPAGVVAVLYFAWMDQRIVNPHDMYWQLGRFVLARQPSVDRADLWQFALGWIVKGFFLPLMLAGAAHFLPVFVREGFGFGSFALLYTSVVVFLYSLDVTYGALGYLLTFRALDAHIRSVEPTGLGWMSAIVCYVPFSTFVWGTFLKYKGSIEWNEWLAGLPLLYMTWGCAILFLLVLYVWATVSFGCRFSNLTNRGIITDGPYRLFRHPAYLAKNVAWWMMYIPFAAHLDWQSALKGCICLGLTNLIYVVRARTEERHLMADPAYRAYYDWMERNGVVAQCRSLLRPRRKGDLVET